MLGAASLYGLFVAMRQRALAEQPFVTRDQFRRVLQVLVPTFLFVLLTALLGLYVASFILVAASCGSSARSRLGSRCSQLSSSWR
jgi:putative tricarboxylic transport membrane protein